MALMIDDPEVEHLAAKLAERTGETPAQVATRILREHAGVAAAAIPARKKPSEVLAAARERLARLPDLDPRTAEEIIGYDERGLPA